jgi:hypothetical protein
MWRMFIDCLDFDSTSIKAHPGGTGAPKKTARKRLANRDKGLLCR